MNKCIICGTEKILKPAGVNRITHKPYDEFWACPNYKNHPKESNVTYKDPTGHEKAYGELMVLEEVQLLRKEFNQRMDALAQYLSQKLK